MVPGEDAIGATPFGGDRPQKDRQRGTRPDGFKLLCDPDVEQPGEAAVLKAVRKPVEAAVQLTRLEKLFPEKQPEQRLPERVLGEEDPVAFAAHDAGDARLRVAAIGVVDGQRDTGAQQRGTGSRPPPAELPGVEVGGEDVLAVAGRIVDHPPQQFLGIYLPSNGKEQPRKSLVAVRRGAGAIKLDGELLLAPLLEELPGLASGAAAEV